MLKQILKSLDDFSPHYAHLPNPAVGNEHFSQTDSRYNTEDVTYDKQVTLACHDLFILYSNAFSEASNFNLVEFNQGTQEKQRSPS